MRSIYIAGKMTGVKNYNAEAFDAAEMRLLESGEWDAVFNPAEYDRQKYGRDFLNSETGSVDEAKAKGFNLRETLADDLEWICRHADAMYMLDGWHTSKGANAEHALAVALGLDIIYERVENAGLTKPFSLIPDGTTVAPAPVKDFS